METRLRAALAATALLDQGSTAASRPNEGGAASAPAGAAARAPRSRPVTPVDATPESALPAARAPVVASAASAVPSGGAAPASPSVSPSVGAKESAAAPAGDDAPAWPSAEAEAAFLGEAAARGEDVGLIAPSSTEEAEPETPLPPLAAQVESLPLPVRDALEDLFRAKYVRILRVRKKDLA